jgi:hypothetical protein
MARRSLTAIAGVSLLALLAVLGSACGARTPAGSSPPQAAKPAVGSHAGSGTASFAPDDHGGSGSIVFFSDNGSTPRRAAQELYAVFNRPPGAADHAAAALASADGFLAPPGDSSPAAERLGRPSYPDTRLVAGTIRRGLYATPTTAGAVCIGVIPNGGGGCAEPGPHGITLGWDDAGDGSPSDVYGMAGDDVRSVEFTVDGKPRTVDVADNAYRLEIPRASRPDLETFVLHLTDGTTVPLG